MDNLLWEYERKIVAYRVKIEFLPEATNLMNYSGSPEEHFRSRVIAVFYDRQNWGNECHDDFSVIKEDECIVVTEQYGHSLFMIDKWKKKLKC